MNKSFGTDVASRYSNDTTFRNLVDQMVFALQLYHFTPSELRQAAILAATMHEARITRSFIIDSLDGTKYPVAFGGVVNAAKKAREHVHSFSYRKSMDDYKTCICGMSSVYYNAFCTGDSTYTGPK